MENVLKSEASSEQITPNLVHKLDACFDDAQHNSKSDDGKNTILIPTNILLPKISKKALITVVPIQSKPSPSGKKIEINPHQKVCFLLLEKTAGPDTKRKSKKDYSNKKKSETPTSSSCSPPKTCKISIQQTIDAFNKSTSSGENCKEVPTQETRASLLETVSALCTNFGKLKPGSQHQMFLHQMPKSGRSYVAKKKHVMSFDPSQFKINDVRSLSKSSNSFHKYIDIEALALDCSFIRIGAFKILPSSSSVIGVTVTKTSFCFRTMENEDSAVTLMWSDLNEVIFHFGDLIPVVFLRISTEYAKKIICPFYSAKGISLDDVPESEWEKHTRLSFIISTLTSTSMSFLRRVCSTYFPINMIGESEALAILSEKVPPIHVNTELQNAQKIESEVLPSNSNKQHLKVDTPSTTAANYHVENTAKNYNSTDVLETKRCGRSSVNTFKNEFVTNNVKSKKSRCVYIKQKGANDATFQKDDICGKLSISMVEKLAKENEKKSLQTEIKCEKNIDDNVISVETSTTDSSKDTNLENSWENSTIAFGRLINTAAIEFFVKNKPKERASDVFFIEDYCKESQYCKLGKDFPKESIASNSLTLENITKNREPDSLTLQSDITDIGICNDFGNSTLRSEKKHHENFNDDINDINPVQFEKTENCVKIKKDDFVSPTDSIAKNSFCKNTINFDNIERNLQADIKKKIESLDRSLDNIRGGRTVNNILFMKDSFLKGSGKHILKGDNGKLTSSNAFSLENLFNEYPEDNMQFVEDTMVTNAMSMDNFVSGLHASLDKSPCEKSYDSKPCANNDVFGNIADLVKTHKRACCDKNNINTDIISKEEIQPMISCVDPLNNREPRLFSSTTKKYTGTKMPSTSPWSRKQYSTLKRQNQESNSVNQSLNILKKYIKLDSKLRRSSNDGACMGSQQIYRQKSSYHAYSKKDLTLPEAEYVLPTSKYEMSNTRSNKLVKVKYEVTSVNEGSNYLSSEDLFADESHPSLKLRIKKLQERF